jgi:PAS domain S-box-containing protein
MTVYMTPRVYPFIDIAVLDAVRGHFLAGDAIAILSTDLETVIWANGPGAALFNHGDIESVRGAPANLGFPARRQIAGTPGFPAIGRNKALLVRVAQGVTSRAIGFLASEIALPDGVQAILLVAPDVEAAKRSAADIAARAIHGIAEAEHHAALIDGAGDIIAASAEFGTIGFAPDALADLAGDVMLEADRLAKRLVTAGGLAYPVGIARLADDPARNLVIVVDDPQSVDESDEAEAPDAPEPPTELSAGPATPPRAQSSRAAADDSDNWYFADVAPVRPALTGPKETASAGPRGELIEEPPLAGSEEAPTAADAGVGDATGVDEVEAAQPPGDEAPAAGDVAVEDATADDPVEHDVARQEPEAAVDDASAFAALTPANDVGTANDAALHETVSAPGDDSTGQAFAAEAVSPEMSGEDSAAPVFKPDLKSGPVRFVWRTDAEGKFNAISDEFGGAVGKAAADIVGRPFRDVALTFGLDPDDDIAGLLERRDTWSGRSVMWPIEGTDLKVPVDLAALPVYARDRSFEGFRGFGVVRVGDAVVDDEAIGLSLARVQPTKPSPAEPADTPVDAQAVPPAKDPFDGEIPAISVDTTPERRQTDKVIRLAEHRPASNERTLSPIEKNAFREIGDRLKQAGAEASAAEGDGSTEEEQSEPASALDEADPFDAASGPSGVDDDASVESGAEPVGSDESETVEPDEAGQSHLVETATGNAVDDADQEGAEVHGDAGETWPAYEPGGIEPASAGKAEADVHAPVVEEPDEFALAVEDYESSGDVDDEDPEAQLYRVQGLDGIDFPADDDELDDDRDEDDPDSRHRSRGVDTSILERLPVPVLIHSGDRLHYANTEFLELTGYVSVLELEQDGGLDALFVDTDSDDRDPDDHRRRLRSRNGDEFPVDALLQSVPWNGGKALLLALKPAPVAAAPAASDAELAELESRVSEMSTILDTATDGIVIIANDGAIRSISRPAEALFGFDTATVAGKPFVSLFAVESQRAARDYLNGLSDNGVASVLNDGREVIGREAQGRFIPLFMTIGKLPGANGYCAVLRDITQWKRAEEELTQARAEAERASSQKTEFLARISHEIRTPLNAIIGFSELMIDEKFGPIVNDRYRDYLRDINRSGNHVLDLVNDLLDISKIEAGEQEMAYEAVSLNETLAETVAMMQPQANRDRVIIRSSFASRLPDVVADLRSVRQIALNLLSNAVRYTQAGGQVIVSTAYEPTGDVVMRVRDTGVGMSQGEIEQALKPFKQINALKRTRGDGTGLGLPLTKAMVEANRARFTIHSAPGEGTMVEIVFPSTRVLAG